MVLGSDPVGGGARSHLVCRLEHVREVDVLGLGGSERLVDLEDFAVTDHFVDRSETETGHDDSKLLGDHVEEVDDLLGLSGELGSKEGVLSGDSDGAGAARREAQIYRSP